MAIVTTLGAYVNITQTRAASILNIKVLFVYYWQPGMSSWAFFWIPNQNIEPTIDANKPLYLAICYKDAAGNYGWLQFNTGSE